MPGNHYVQMRFHVVTEIGVATRLVVNIEAGPNKNPQKLARSDPR